MSDDPKDTAAALKRIADAVRPTTTDAATSRLQEELDNGTSDAQYELLAKLMMVRYKAFIRAGFSDSQALYLLGR